MRVRLPPGVPTLEDLMTNWQDYFKIVEIEGAGPDQFLYDTKYQVIVVNTEQVVGTYKDFKYAQKQAKYKFKKISKRVEKLLLG
jgi:hypothetical protein